MMILTIDSSGKKALLEIKLAGSQRVEERVRASLLDWPLR